ncbi:hypothetical protein pb186bvf_014139 [Paramecium bursaria]
MIAQLLKYGVTIDKETEQRLKFLEIQIPLDQQQELVDEIFQDQQQNLKNTQYQVQLGPSVELDYQETVTPKNLLEEYLSTQQEQLQNILKSNIQSVKELNAFLNDRDIDNDLIEQIRQNQQPECQVYMNKQVINAFTENVQNQIFQLNDNKEINYSTNPNSGKMERDDFKQFVIQQKQLILYNNQVTALQKKYQNTRRLLFDKIEDQNDLSNALVQKQQQNIDNELKLVEKVTQLKRMAKIEKDLHEEVMNLEKKDIQEQSISLDDVKQYNQEKLQKIIEQSLKAIYEQFIEIKNIKVSNNDLIFDQIISMLDQLVQEIMKIKKVHEQNTLQLLDYYQSYPNTKQVINQNCLDLITQCKQDFINYQKCQYLFQGLNEGQEIDKFLINQQKLKEKYESNRLMVDQYNQTQQQLDRKLEDITIYLDQLKQI